MLTVTDAAGSHLAQILKQEELPAEIAIRIIVEGGGLALRPDEKQPGDASFEHEGRTVLLLDEQVADLLSSDTLDVEGSGLTIRAGDDAPE
jgi:Fe-S cluster assembly iron-binding protein IscA